MLPFVFSQFCVLGSRSYVLGLDGSFVNPVSKPADDTRWIGGRNGGEVVVNDSGDPASCHRWGCPWSLECKGGSKECDCSAGEDGVDPTLL